MEKLKKIVLNLGAIASIAFPISAVIACGSNDSEKIENNNANDEKEKT